MHIDLSKMKTSWWEDEDGNIINQPEDCCDKPENGRYFRVCYPCTFVETVDEYCYHPDHPFLVWLCAKSRRFYKWMSKRKDKTFKTIMTMRTGFGSKWAQNCIVSMVNSSDYTLEQAIWIWGNACERCMNVLLHKYTDGEEGYPEDSEQYKKCGTSCSFCEKTPVVDLTADNLKDASVDEAK